MLDVAVVLASVVTFAVGYFGGSFLLAILSACAVYGFFLVVYIFMRRY